MSLKWSVEFRTLKLKYTWAISRNSANEKTNAFISVTDNKLTGWGEAAPNIRYGESPEQFKDIFSSLAIPELKDPVSFSEWLSGSGLPNSLRFGIESAAVSYSAALKGCTISAFLGLPEPQPVNTAYTIPIMAAESLKQYSDTYNLKRFRYIKVKVNSENMVPFVKEARKHFNNTFIIDANEAYSDPDQFMKDLEILNDPDLAFVEQPFAAGKVEEYMYLKNKIATQVFADESVTDEADFGVLKKCFHGVNVKLMKAGGFFNGIRLLKEAKRNGLKTMIGCMVESGLGISAGYTLSSLADFTDLDSFMILQNDPFPFVTEKDGILSSAGEFIKPEFL